MARAVTYRTTNKSLRQPTRLTTINSPQFRAKRGIPANVNLRFVAAKAIRRQFRMEAIRQVASVVGNYWSYYHPTAKVGQTFDPHAVQIGDTFAEWTVYYRKTETSIEYRPNETPVVDYGWTGISTANSGNFRNFTTKAAAENQVNSYAPNPINWATAKTGYIGYRTWDNFVISTGDPQIPFGFSTDITFKISRPSITTTTNPLPQGTTTYIPLYPVVPEYVYPYNTPEYLPTPQGRPRQRPGREASPDPTIGPGLIIEISSNGNTRIREQTATDKRRARDHKIGGKAAGILGAISRAMGEGMEYLEVFTDAIWYDPRYHKHYGQSDMRARFDYLVARLASGELNWSWERF